MAPRTAVPLALAWHEVTKLVKNPLPGCFVNQPDGSGGKAGGPVSPFALSTPMALSDQRTTMMGAEMRPVVPQG